MLLVSETAGGPYCCMLGSQAFFPTPVMKRLYNPSLPSKDLLPTSIEVNYSYQWACNFHLWPFRLFLSSQMTSWSFPPKGRASLRGPQQQLFKHLTSALSSLFHIAPQWCKSAPLSINNCTCEAEMTTKKNGGDPLLSALIGSARDQGEFLSHPYVSSLRGQPHGNRHNTSFR